MDHIEGIVGDIDNGLEAAGPSIDSIQVIEESVWAELEHDVEHGWRTQQEAEDEFFNWREKYLNGTK